jgi:hypothetical protein
MNVLERFGRPTNALRSMALKKHHRSFHPARSWRFCYTLALSALAVSLEDEFTADLDLPLLIQR